MRDQRDRRSGAMERLRRKAWYMLSCWDVVVCAKGEIRCQAPVCQPYKVHSHDRRQPCEDLMVDQRQ